MTHIIGQEKPSLDDLAHHGIKGQKWGVIRDRESGSKSSASPTSKTQNSKTSWQNVPQKKLTPKEATKSLHASQEKFVNKFEPSEAGGSKKGLTPEQKKILIGVGIGAIAVGGALAYAKYAQANGTSPLVKKDYTDHYAELKKAESLERTTNLNFMRDHYAGKPVSEQAFKKAITDSKNNCWGQQGNGFDKVQFDRPEFSLPAGHTFHRISLSEEGTFGKGTYATHSIEDYHRYLVGFSGEKGGVVGNQLHHITFKATDEIKVPSLHTVLDTLKEVQNVGGKNYTDQEVLEGYRQMSGGNWNFGEVHGKLIEALQKKGYGALVDEMDSGVIGESPLVVFANNMSAKSSSPISITELEDAGSKLVELPNRRG